MLSLSLSLDCYISLNISLSFSLQGAQNRVSEWRDASVTGASITSPGSGHPGYCCGQVRATTTTRTPAAARVPRTRLVNGGMPQLLGHPLPHLDLGTLIRSRD